MEKLYFVNKVELIELLQQARLEGGPLYEEFRLGLLRAMDIVNAMDVYTVIPVSEQDHEDESGMMGGFNTLSDTHEIAKALCGLIPDVSDEQIVSECDKAIFCLKALAENKYNHDSFRTMYRVLTKIAEAITNK